MRNGRRLFALTYWRASISWAMPAAKVPMDTSFFLADQLQAGVLELFDDPLALDDHGLEVAGPVHQLAVQLQGLFGGPVQSI